MTGKGGYKSSNKTGLFFCGGGHPCPAKPLHFPGRIMCPAPLWFCISNHRKKCRLNNFCSFFFGDFARIFLGGSYAIGQSLFFLRFSGDV